MYRRRIAYRCGRVPLVYTREVCAFPISNVSILDKLALVGSFNDIVNVIAKNLSYIELLQNCPRQNFFFRIQESRVRRKFLPATWKKYLARVAPLPQERDQATSNE